VERRENADGHADRHRDHHRRQRELHRGRHGAGDHLGHRLAGLERTAQVALEGLHQEVGVLHRQRPVEPQFAADAGDGLGVGPLLESGGDRVARHHVHQDEGDEAHPQEDGNPLQEATHDEGEHGHLPSQAIWEGTGRSGPLRLMGT